ncbi:hypothetical protein [Microcoleus vaginatus]
MHSKQPACLEVVKKALKLLKFVDDVSAARTYGGYANEEDRSI